MRLGREEFHNLVEKYDREFQRSPARYKAKVALIAFGGYAFVLLICVINLLLLGGLILWHRSSGFSGWILAGYLFGGFLLYSILRSLFVRLPLPNGVVLEAEGFPWIHSKIKKLRKPLRLRFRKVHILLNMDYNASAISRPMFGLFGPAKFYVCLGLPLVATLSESQLEAILAHELAHISRRHGSFFAWLARLRMVWFDLLDRLKRRRFTLWFILGFAKWYYQYFEAATVILSRKQEFEADELANEVVGKGALAQALLRFTLRGGLVVDEYWQGVWRRSLVAVAPEPTAISGLIYRLGKPLKQDEAVKELRWLLGTKAEVFDTHPSLADRLGALNVTLPVSEDDIGSFIKVRGLSLPTGVIAQMVGKNSKEAACFLDACWEVCNIAEWRQRNEESVLVRKILTSIDDEWKNNGTISVEKAWKRAWITAECYGPEKAQSLVEYVLKRDENHAPANFLYGTQLFRKYDVAGISHIESAIEADPLIYREVGLVALADFFRRMGSVSDATESKHLSFSAGDLTDKALLERGKRTSSSSTFIPHQLSECEIKSLQESFMLIPGIKKVLLAVRQVEYMPESPFYVFGVVPTLSARFHKNRIGTGIVEGVAFSKFHQFLVLGISNFLLRLKLKRVRGSVIYARKRRWFW